jgi:hypothetical protein
MKLSEILATTATAIANDPALELYCQGMWNKSISVYVHIDPKNPPSTDKAPWVGLTVQGYRRPSEYNTRVISFDLESAVFCFEPKAVPAPETTVGDVTILKGFETLEDLSDLVFNAIEQAVVTSPLQLQTTYNDEQQTNLVISDFPGWIASRIWTISKHV